MTHSSPENADLLALHEWMREPDWAENFSLEDIGDWINRRPIHITTRLSTLAQQTDSPVNADTEGYTEAEGYAASLRQQADLMEKANAGKVSAYVAIDDFDVDELRDAADFIERISAQQMTEPATYQWRFQYENGEWSKWQNVTSPWDGKRNPDWEYRPLYAFTSPGCTSSDGSEVADGAIEPRGLTGASRKCQPSQREGETTPLAGVTSGPSDAILPQQMPDAIELTEDMLEAGAQALADDVWHPPIKLSLMAKHEASKFRRQALITLKAATALTRPECVATDNDAEKPTCKHCGARVYAPCETRHQIDRCELPPFASHESKTP